MNLSPYAAYAKKNFLARSAYRFDHIMSIIATCLEIFIYWGIYRALYGTSTEVNGITFGMVTTNFVLSMGLKAGFSVDDFYMPNKIGDGSIATELLRPISLRGRMIAENMGDAGFNLLFRFLPSLIIAICMVGIYPPCNGCMFILFIVSSVLGYGILWTISYAVQMLSFWLVNIWSIVTIKNVFVNVLSGSMIPLWFMPDWMQGIINWTPFSSIYFTPIQIYLGQLSGSEIVKRCCIQVIWILIIFNIGSILWNKGQKKLIVQGG